jgi:hypothetical protein
MSTSLKEIYTQVCERLSAYITAEAAILGGAQSYSIGNRSLTRADLEWVSKEIRKLYGEKLSLERGNVIRVHRVVPRDI